MAAVLAMYCFASVALAGEAPSISHRVDVERKAAVLAEDECDSVNLLQKNILAVHADQAYQDGADLLAEPQTLREEEAVIKKVQEEQKKVYMLQLQDSQTGDRLSPQAEVETTGWGWFGWRRPLNRLFPAVAMIVLLLLICFFACAADLDGYKGWHAQEDGTGVVINYDDSGKEMCREASMAENLDDDIVVEKQEVRVVNSQHGSKINYDEYEEDDYDREVVYTRGGERDAVRTQGGERAVVYTQGGATTGARRHTMRTTFSESSRPMGPE